MEISKEFEVARPLATVWALFQDVPQVAQCLPGAELTEDRGDGVYAGKLSVKLGPMSANFDGEATVEADDVNHVGTVSGKGADRRGGSRGQVKVTYALADTGGGTKVSVDADIHLSGAAAQFGRVGLINEMSGRLITEFVECLEAKLAAETTEEAAQVEAGEVRGIALLFQSLWAWIRRLLSGSR